MGSRDLFPELGFDAYLAHAAISPASLAVSAALAATAASVAELGVGSFPVWMEQRERLRKSAAEEERSVGRYARGAASAVPGLSKARCHASGGRSDLARCPSSESRG